MKIFLRQINEIAPVMKRCLRRLADEKWFELDDWIVIVFWDRGR